jgi:hypothetical protein
MSSGEMLTPAEIKSLRENKRRVLEVGRALLKHATMRSPVVSQARVARNRDKDRVAPSRAKS